MLRLKVARKLVIIEGDLERTEERAELTERYDAPAFTATKCTLTLARTLAFQQLEL